MTNKNDVAELRVSGQTHPSNLGGAIVNYLDEVEQVKLKAMGPEAVNQAVKGIIAAKSYVASHVKKLDVEMGFNNKIDEVSGDEITLIIFVLTLED